MRLALMLSLIVSMAVIGNGQTPSYFGNEGLAYLERLARADRTGLTHLLTGPVTNIYPALFTYTGEPSLLGRPGAGVSVLRIAQTAGFLAPSCRITCFAISEKAIRVTVAVCERQTPPRGSFYGRLQKGERLLTDKEQSTLRRLLARFDVTQLPTDPVEVFTDSPRLLFEYRDQNHHVLIPRCSGSVTNLLEDFDRFSQRMVRTNMLQAVGSANGSQPIRAETNRTSSAAGSRR